MELMIAGKMRTVTTVSQHELDDILPSGDNILIYGTSGEGKSAKIHQYAEKIGADLVVINLALDVPETIGGVPYALATQIIEDGEKEDATEEQKTASKKMKAKKIKETVEYFTKLLNVQLEPLFVDNGRKKILFLDEINQAQQEVMNCLYSIADVDPDKRNWAGRPLKNVQVIAAGNKDDGSDGTTYLTPLPTPLHNRFNIFELVPNKADTKKYLKEKWKNIPQVAKYIDVLLENDIPPRDIEGVLDKIAFEKNPKLIECKIGSALTIKLMDIQKKIKSFDPAKSLKLCKNSYEIFKEDGQVQWAGELIETEEELLDKFAEILSEEEIKSITEGGE